MPITTLRIANFRNLTALNIEALPGLNVISGDNGSGKTSMLEAIHYLSLGRSFRVSSASRLIQQDCANFSLFAQILSDSETLLPVGVERHDNGTTRMRIAEKDVPSIAELAASLPIRLINSQAHHLFESGPSYRRKYVDWGLFYQTDIFLTCWRQFERVLKQRNALLKENRPKNELNGWTIELVKYSLQLNQMRKAYIAEITPTINELTNYLLEMDGLTIEYDPGWDEDCDLATLFADNFAQEYRAGYTLFGPQRADIDIRIQDIPVKHFLSRGQQKLLICAMILAQGMLLAKHEKNPIYLVDDLPSELDNHSRDKLISLLVKQPAQIFITAIEHEPICELLHEISDKPLKVFHVKHGNVSEMINERCRQS